MSALRRALARGLRGVGKIPSGTARRKQTATRVADKKAAEAKAKGATGRGGPSSQRVLRNSAIVARAWAGVSQKRIAAEFGVTDRTVRTVLAEYEALPSGLERRPMEVVEDLARAYRMMYADLRALAERYEATNAAAAIGATRQARETLADYVTLLASIGKLPTDLEVLAAQADLLRMGDLILEAIERLERGEISAAQLGELVRGFVLAKGLPPGQVIEGRESDSQDGKRKRKRGGGPTTT